MYICHMLKTNVFSRAMVWLSRIGNCRGFGIQSPWAYSFVRYVVNEHFPYYKYEELGNLFSNLDVSQRKLGEFYLRLANFVQPETVKLVFVENDVVEKRIVSYVKAGCQKCKVLSYYPINNVFSVISKNRKEVGKPTIYILDGWHFLFADLPKFISKLKDGDFVVAERIYEEKDIKDVWNEFVAQLSGVLVFDLYYCAVIYVDRKRYTHKYKINF